MPGLHLLPKFLHNWAGKSVCHFRSLGTLQVLSEIVFESDEFNNFGVDLERMQLQYLRTTI